MAVTHGWSLTNRLTALVAGVILVILATTVVTAQVFLARVFEHEMESLAREELDELEAICSTRPLTEQGFTDLCTALASHHPEVSLRVGIRPDGGDWTWSPAPPAGWEASSSSTLPHEGQFLASRLATVLLPGGEYPTPAEYAVHIDGTRLAINNRTMMLRVFSALGGATLLGLLLTLVLHRRLGGLLADVAQATRQAAAAPEGVSEVEARAPREVSSIIRALRGLLAELEEKHQRQALMVAGLAHDLRSPIQLLLGEAELALRKPRSAEEYKETIELQSEELLELAGVLENLLMMLGQDRSLDARAREWFDLGREAELRLSRERSWAGRMGIQMELRREGDLDVSGDREILLLALRNLVRNALDHAPVGSTILVTLRGETDGCSFTVEDAGPGIPPEDRERLLRPFETGRAPSRRRRTGGGLGLALVAQAARVHEGTLMIGDSSLGGARVEVRLPRGAQRPRDAGSPHRATA